MNRYFWQLSLLMLIALTQSVSAHTVSPSQMTLQWQTDHEQASAALHIELQIPVDQLVLALPQWQPIYDEESHQLPADTLLDSANQTLIQAYLQQHLQLTRGDHPIALSLNEVKLEVSAGLVDLAPLQWLKLTGVWQTADEADSSNQALILTSDLVVHQVTNHRIYVQMLNHEGRFRFGYQTHELDFQRLGWLISQTEPQQRSDFEILVDYLMEGVMHILHGADHLAFILCLLLAAMRPNSSTNSHAHESELASALRHAALTLTAFTIGHGSALALAAMGWPLLPVTTTELLVALSVWVAAMALLVPQLAALNGARLAGLFGLIHGTAFAEILTELQVEGMDRVLALLGFNLGVELAQLLIALWAIPLLWLLMRQQSAWASWLQTGLAALLVLMSAGWVLQRQDLLASMASGWLDLISLPALWVGVLLLPVLAILSSLTKPARLAGEGRT